MEATSSVSMVSSSVLTPCLTTRNESNPSAVLITNYKFRNWKLWAVLVKSLINMCFPQKNFSHKIFKNVFSHVYHVKDRRMHATPFVLKHQRELAATGFPWCPSKERPHHATPLIPPALLRLSSPGSHLHLLVESSIDISRKGRADRADRTVRALFHTESIGH